MIPDNYKNFLTEWNIRFPIDRWWRKKFNVSFNSPKHRKSSFIDQSVDYYEDRLFEELLSEKDDKYIPNVGDFIQSSSNLSEIQQLKAEFNDIEDDG